MFQDPIGNIFTIASFVNYLCIEQSLLNPDLTTSSVAHNHLTHEIRVVCLELSALKSMDILVNPDNSPLLKWTVQILWEDPATVSHILRELVHARPAACAACMLSLANLQ